jgi:hypothetical protein
VVCSNGIQWVKNTIKFAISNAILGKVTKTVAQVSIKESVGNFKAVYPSYALDDKIAVNSNTIFLFQHQSNNMFRTDRQYRNVYKALVETKYTVCILIMCNVKRKALGIKTE